MPAGILAAPPAFADDLARRRRGSAPDDRARQQLHHERERPHRARDVDDVASPPQRVDGRLGDLGRRRRQRRRLAARRHLRRDEAGTDDEHAHARRVGDAAGEEVRRRLARGVDVVRRPGALRCDRRQQHDRPRALPLQPRGEAQERRAAAERVGAQEGDGGVRILRARPFVAERAERHHRDVHAAAGRGPRGVERRLVLVGRVGVEGDRLHARTADRGRPEALGRAAREHGDVRIERLRDRDPELGAAPEHEDGRHSPCTFTCSAST